MSQLQRDEHESAPVRQFVITNPTVGRAVVGGAAWAQGLRRALAPDSLHRIGFAMRQHVRRNRRQRREELKAARRLVREQAKQSTLGARR